MGFERWFGWGSKAPEEKKPNPYAAPEAEVDPVEEGPREYKGGGTADENIVEMLRFASFGNRRVYMSGYPDMFVEPGDTIEIARERYKKYLEIRRQEHEIYEAKAREREEEIIKKLRQGQHPSFSIKDQAEWDADVRKYTEEDTEDPDAPFAVEALWTCAQWAHLLEQELAKGASMKAAIKKTESQIDVRSVVIWTMVKHWTRGDEFKKARK